MMQSYKRKQHHIFHCHIGYRHISYNYLKHTKDIRKIKIQRPENICKAYFWIHL
jgi:hypothetical protein